MTLFVTVQSISCCLDFCLFYTTNNVRLVNQKQSLYRRIPLCTEFLCITRGMLLIKHQTCQLTPIKSVTHAFDITHTLTRIHNSFTRIPPNLAVGLKKSIMYTNLLTDMLPHVIDLPPVTSQ